MIDGVVLLQHRFQASVRRSTSTVVQSFGPQQKHNSRDEEAAATAKQERDDEHEKIGQVLFKAFFKSKEHSRRRWGPSPDMFDTFYFCR